MEDNQGLLVNGYSDLIDKLPGVIKSSIVQSGDTITEIHVLSDTSRSPKQIARDIQSAIFVQFDTTIDHKVISIAQIPSENTQRIKDRLVFEEISISKSKNRSTATVSLCDGETAYSGEASALNDSVEINKMICQATLNAVSNFIEPDMSLSPIDVKLFDLTEEKAVAVCIAVNFKNSVERYLGSSFVGDDAGYAVVKATLDALNRKISNL
ncbi:hypothetical protein [Caproiciproducens faecalis]|uniref:Uncharacterized protein n=1 Tax=Caproiciproducens faecalis TaxID=2820301 RepID=A0ABS7DMU0_9FIRM|nr:hypothetical protein [Caproiciproducens faecalis]MBW7572621.1 hypothetical protein [Caproiciproducens faecalis]